MLLLKRFLNRSLTEKNGKFGIINMNWTHLTDISQLDEIVKNSHNNLQLIFKHSTRCSISAAAFDRLQRKWQGNEILNVEPLYLDLIKYRDVSNEIVSRFGVAHQSPQAILIKDGKAIYDNSHFGIDYEEIKQIAGSVLT